MKQLTPTEAAELMFALIQKVRKDTTENGPKFSLATAATLFASLKNPGELLTDISKEIGGLTDSGISRQFDLLEANGRSPDGFSDGLVQRTPSPHNYKYKCVTVTPEGMKFAADFAKYFNRMLEITMK